MRRVDSEGGEVADRGLAEQVAADLGDHHDFRAAQPRGDRLVGAFAAETQIETPAEHRLAGPRKRVAERDEIGVGAADDGNPGGIRHAAFSHQLMARHERRCVATARRWRALPILV